MWIRWRAALATGYILMYFSELVFWARFDPGGKNALENIAITLVMWLLYSVEGFIFLALIDRYQIRSVWALYLAGAFYGWTLEGVIAPTMYWPPVLYIAWTGLAWHALIDVMVGWYALRQALVEHSTKRIILIAGGIGLFWSFWSIFWWIELDEVTPPGEFALYAWITTLGLIAAYVVLNRTQPAEFRPNKVETYTIGLILTVWFLVDVTMIPYAPLILLPLLALIIWVLRKNRRIETEESLLVTLRGPVTPLHYILVLMIPLLASVTYLGYTLIDARLPTNFMVLLVTVFLGVGFFVQSIRQIYRADGYNNLT
jgi:hypothetical protein